MIKLGVFALLLAACDGHPIMQPRDATSGSDVAPAGKRIAYVGGYGSDISWYAVARDTGVLAPAGTQPAFAASPSFLAIDPAGTALYAVSEATNRVGAYAIDRASGDLTFIDDVSSGGSGPAHVAVDRSGRWVFVANYGDGAIAVLPIRADHGLAAPHQTLVAGANAHMMIADPSNKYVLVPCKGSDYVAQYTFDAATGMLAPNQTPHFATAAGAGPRHLAFAPDGRHAYLIDETASTMMALAFDPATGRLSALQTISTLPAGVSVPNTGAEVWVAPSGAFVYGSNRGDDSIVTYAVDATGRLSLVAHTKTGGKTPRDFTLGPDGRFLYAANQASDNVVVFALDAATGVPTATGAQITASMPAFVGVATLP